MRFQINHEQGHGYCWELQGSPPDYPVLAVGPDGYATEEDARKAIHRARVAMRGYKFAKVVADEDE